MRTNLTSSTRVFYVSESGNDANDCHTPSTPGRTIQRAVDVVKLDYDTYGIQPWIYVAPGTYPGWQDYAPQVGAQPHGGGPLVIAAWEPGGQPQGTVTIQGTSGVAPISLDGGAVQTIVGLTINHPNAPAVYTTNGAIAEVGLLNLTGGTYGLFADAGGTIIATSTLAYSGTFVYGMMGNLGGYASVVPGVIVSWASGTTFTGQFLFGANQGRVVFPIPGVTMQGSFIGQKYYASMLGIVNCSGNRESLPGTISGGYNYGGQAY